MQATLQQSSFCCLLRLLLIPGMPTLVGKRGSCPLCPHSWGQEGQELPFLLNSVHLLSTGEAFSGIVDSLVQETFSGGKPPHPPIVVVLLGDRCSKHYSSGKEFEDQNLAMWRNIYMHRFALIGSLPPCPRCAQVSLINSSVFGASFTSHKCLCAKHWN